MYFNLINLKNVALFSGIFFQPAAVLKSSGFIKGYCNNDCSQEYQVKQTCITLKLSK